MPNERVSLETMGKAADSWPAKGDGKSDPDEPESKVTRVGATTAATATTSVGPRRPKEYELTRTIGN
jgi:hypothetical protein